MSGWRFYVRIFLFTVIRFIDFCLLVLFCPFYFVLGYGDCSHEIKRRLHLGRKVMTNLDSILKGRGITLPTKVCLVKAMVFPVVMYGCESWSIKEAERRRIDTFELWCWRRLFFLFQTVSSFINDTFQKQSWYFRQDMGRQSLTAYNFQTPFFNGL